MDELMLPFDPSSGRTLVDTDETPGLLALANTAGLEAARRADQSDRDGAFPTEDIRLLHHLGLLHAPFSAAQGGDSLGIGRPQLLRDVLAILGQGSLALGRLYEGHVNAVALVTRYGTAGNVELLLRVCFGLQQ